MQCCRKWIKVLYFALCTTLILLQCSICYADVPLLLPQHKLDTSVLTKGCNYLVISALNQFPKIKVQLQQRCRNTWNWLSNNISTCNFIVHFSTELCSGTVFFQVFSLTINVVLVTEIVSSNSYPFHSSVTLYLFSKGFQLKLKASKPNWQPFFLYSCSPLW